MAVQEEDAVQEQQQGCAAAARGASRAREAQPRQLARCLSLGQSPAGAAVPLPGPGPGIWSGLGVILELPCCHSSPSDLALTPLQLLELLTGG